MTASHAQDTGPDLHRMVDELVKEHVHREPYIVRGQLSGLGRVAHHQARVPALIDQLLEPEPGGSGEMAGAGSESRPAVRVEAHDTIALIADETWVWIDKLGGTVPADVIDPGRKHHALRGSGAKRSLVVLRALVAGLPGDQRCGRAYGQRIEVEIEPETPGTLEFDSKDSLLGELVGVLTEGLDGPEFDSKDSHLGNPDEASRTRPLPRKEWCCTTHHVESDVRSWWRQARIIAGWDAPTYRPFATCPSCSKRKGLRINLGSHSAVCVECRTVWGPDMIGLLAEHIRRENGLEDDDLEGELVELEPNLDTPESA